MPGRPRAEGGHVMVRCDRCQYLLEEPGALLFSPTAGGGACTKYHLCVRCYEDLKRWLFGKGDDVAGGEAV